MGHYQLYSVLLLLLLHLLHLGACFVIAPPWANPAANPCSSRSWQLIYWPPDGTCHQIFSRGPCPRTQELQFDRVNGRAVCRCPKDLLYWPATDRCYKEFSKGPCQPNQYLERRRGSTGGVSGGRVPRKLSSPVGVASQCSDVGRCDNGWIFWPPEGKCHQLYTQGPCHKGDLLIVNPLSAEPYCGCDPLLLRQYYFDPLQLCYEHFTRGPCESGLLFAYNHTSGSTGCLCSPALHNFHPASARCHQFGSKGPCNKGQVFALDEDAGQGRCTCKEGYILWRESGQCYKAFTPGPCGDSEFIVPFSSTSDYASSSSSALMPSSSPTSVDDGVCVRNPCPKAHLYFPDDGGVDDGVRCHKVGSRGPCALGELVVFEKYSGKSYRGECGCSPGYNQNYWTADGRCYEWYTRGPCDEGFLFQYDRGRAGTECVCDRTEGFVFWNETQKCYRVYTQGPCPEHAWLIPADDDGASDDDGIIVDGNDVSPASDVFCECRLGFRFDPRSYTCKPVRTTSSLTSPAAASTRLARPRAQPLLTLLPYQAARAGGGASTWRGSTSTAGGQLSLLERLRQLQKDRAGQAAAAVRSKKEKDEEEDEEPWGGGEAAATGIFVTPGGGSGGGPPRRRRGGPSADRRKDGPNYSSSPWTSGPSPRGSAGGTRWGVAQGGVAQQGGGNPKALPRVARMRRFRRLLKNRNSQSSS